MNLKRRPRALPFALAAASLTFGSGCVEVDESTDDDGSDVDEGDAGAQDGGATTGAGGGRNTRNTGGVGTRTGGTSGGDAGAGTEGTSGGSDTTGGTSGGSTDGTISAYSRALCGKYVECDPEAFETYFGSDRDACEQDFETYYVDYYTDYFQSAPDPAACEAAIDTYFDCLAELYTEQSCEAFLNDDQIEGCETEGAALEPDCGL